MFDYIIAAAAVIILGACAVFTVRALARRKKTRAFEHKILSRPVNQPLAADDLEDLRCAANGITASAKKNAEDTQDRLEKAMKEKPDDRNTPLSDQHKQQGGAIDPDDMQKYAGEIKMYGGMGAFKIQNAVDGVEKLSELKDGGIITEEQFEAAKKQLLGL